MLIVNIAQGACHFPFYQYSQPILWLCITITKSLSNYLTYNTKNRWHIFDANFAIGGSAIWNHFVWYSISVLVFWHPFYHHVLSPLSLNCSLIIQINVSFQIYFKVSANCRWLYTEKVCFFQWIFMTTCVRGSPWAAVMIHVWTKQVRVTNQ